MRKSDAVMRPWIPLNGTHLNGCFLLQSDSPAAIDPNPVALGSNCILCWSYALSVWMQRVNNPLIPCVDLARWAASFRLLFGGSSAPTIVKRSEQTPPPTQGSF